jgi:hypothetical protein
MLYLYKWEFPLLKMFNLKNYLNFVTDCKKSRCLYMKTELPYFLKSNLV